MSWGCFRSFLCGMRDGSQRNHKKTHKAWSVDRPNRWMAGFEAERIKTMSPFWGCLAWNPFDLCFDQKRPLAMLWLQNRGHVFLGVLSWTGHLPVQIPDIDPPLTPPNHPMGWSNIGIHGVFGHRNHLPCAFYGHKKKP